MREVVDIHTHILPGIDDGAKNWDMCLKMINKSWDFGVRKIIATPHYVPWRREIPVRKIQELCREAEENAKRELGKPMKIYPGNELYYHLELIDKLNEGKVLTLADSRYILVEFDIDVPYRELYQGLSRLRMEQYHPIVAHVERYRCLRKPGRLEEVKRTGALFQMNQKAFQKGSRLRMEQYHPIVAHVERYRCLRKPGRLEEVKRTGALFQMNQKAFQKGLLDETGRWSRQRLKQGEIDFIASDMHNLTSREPFDEKNMSWLYKKMPKKSLHMLLSKKAREI